MAQTVLITGATGFVGQGLVAHPDRRGSADPAGGARRRRGRQRRHRRYRAGHGLGPARWRGWTRSSRSRRPRPCCNGQGARRAGPVPQGQHCRHQAAGRSRLEQAGVRRFVLMRLGQGRGRHDRRARHRRDRAGQSPRTRPTASPSWRRSGALWDAARSMEAVVLRPPLVYGPGVKAKFPRAAPGWSIPACRCRFALGAEPAQRHQLATTWSAPSPSRHDRHRRAGARLSMSRKDRADLDPDAESAIWRGRWAGRRGCCHSRPALIAGLAFLAGRLRNRRQPTGHARSQRLCFPRRDRLAATSDAGGGIRGCSEVVSMPGEVGRLNSGSVIRQSDIVWIEA